MTAFLIVVSDRTTIAFSWNHRQPAIFSIRSESIDIGFGQHLQTRVFLRRRLRLATRL
jgi:hypothetical protein